MHFSFNQMYIQSKSVQKMQNTMIASLKIINQSTNQMVCVVCGVRACQTRCYEQRGQESQLLIFHFIYWEKKHRRRIDHAISTNEMVWAHEWLPLFWFCFCAPSTATIRRYTHTHTLDQNYWNKLKIARTHTHDYFCNDFKSI